MRLYSGVTALLFGLALQPSTYGDSLIIRGGKPIKKLEPRPEGEAPEELKRPVLQGRKGKGSRRSRKQ